MSGQSPLYSNIYRSVLYRLLNNINAYYKFTINVAVSFSRGRKLICSDKRMMVKLQLGKYM